MILKSVEFSNLGPFYGSASLTLEPEVTVLTGANDTGKTFVLEAIRIALSGTEITEDLVNEDYHFDVRTSWKTDHSISIAIGFALSDRSASQHPSLKSGDELHLRFHLTPENRKSGPYQIAGFRRSGQDLNQEAAKSIRLPTLLEPRLDRNSDIRATISLSGGNELEKSLLSFAFHTPTPDAKLRDVNDRRYERLLEEASQRLSEAVRAVFPTVHPLQFRFKHPGPGQDRSHVALTVRDRYEGETPIPSRGAGIRRLLSLLVPILHTDRSGKNYVMLLDEPEIHLHADAQHLVRRALEDAAAKPGLQVLYATHSSAMMNQMRRHSIRLLTRTHKDGNATTIISAASEDILATVRTSLGIAPADSLLFAVVNVIVEGPSDSMCLPILLERLYRAGREGFSDLDRLLPEVRLLPGNGDSFLRLCKVVRGQGLKAVVFVDGDKLRRVSSQRVREELPDVPIVHLPEGTELEDLIPRDLFFEVLAETVPADGMSISSDAYDTWEQTALATGELRKETLFGKRVDAWLSSGGTWYGKPHVLSVCAQRVDLDQLRHVDKLRELVGHIRRLVEASFA